MTNPSQTASQTASGLARFAGMRDFFLIWFGQLISGIGSRLSTFALGIWVLQQTGSATKFAMIFVAMAVPALAISPFAGALVDRWDRRKTMIACGLISALSMAVMALLLAHNQLALWHIYLGVGVTAVANAFHMPAYSASIPLLVNREQLANVNGLVQTGQAVAKIAGPLLAGVLVISIELYGVLIVDGISFLAAALALFLAKVPNPAAGKARESMWASAATGWRYVREREGLFGLMLVFGGTNFLYGIASVAITPLVLAFANPAELGVQYAVGGAGLLLGGLLMTATGGVKQKIHGLLGCSMLAGLALAGHGIWASFIPVCLAAFLFFLVLPLINASNDSLWQTKVPPHLQGRCFAIQRVLTESALPIGFALAGPLAEYVFEPLLMPGGALASSVGSIIGVGKGRGVGLMFICIGLLVTTITACGYLIKSIREVDQLPDALEEAKTEPAPAANNSTSHAAQVEDNKVPAGQQEKRQAAA